MFLIPKSEVTIGKQKFYGDNTGIMAVEIQQSVDKMVGSARITLPRNFRRKDGTKLTDIIKKGDEVTIRLGYHPDMHDEFSGYVTDIGAGTPLVVECENYWYKYKHAAQLSKSWKSTTVNDVLRFIFKGYEVDNNVNATLSTGYVIKNATPYEVVDSLCKSAGITVVIDEKNKKVFAGYPYQMKGASHTYSFTQNVAKNDLKYITKDSSKIQFTATGKDAKGKVIKVKVGYSGSDAEKRTLSYSAKTESELKKLAKDELKRLVFDGYEGKITGFGTPRVCAGDNITIVDNSNPDRQGTFLVKSVRISYGITSGFRRECELSYKIK